MFFFKSDTIFLTPDTQAFVNKLAEKGAPPLHSLTPQQARKVLLDVQAQSAAHHVPPAQIKDVELPVGPTGKVSTRFVRPEGADGPLPVILYIHGGGWVMGDKHTHDRLIRELAVGAHAALVFPEYTPSPEAQYPVPLEQIYSVLTHVTEKAEQYSLDPSRIAVAGDSVGGNMTAAITIMAKDRQGPQLAFQLLLYPVTSADFGVDSYKTFADGPWLTRDSMQWFWDAYCPDVDKRDDILVSPLQADTEKLQGLPPALVITDENDVLRDEGEAYARKLMRAGVPTAAVRYLGTHHDFMMLNALADTPPARAATRQACDALIRVLHP